MSCGTRNGNTRRGAERSNVGVGSLNSIRIEAKENLTNSSWAALVLERDSRVAPKVSIVNKLIVNDGITAPTSIQRVGS